MKALLIVANHMEGWDIDSLRKGNEELELGLPFLTETVQRCAKQLELDDPPSLRTSTNDSIMFGTIQRRETGHRALATVVHHVEGCEVSHLRKEREHLLSCVEEQINSFERMCNNKIESLRESCAEDEARLSLIDRERAHNDEDLVRLEAEQRKNEEKNQANIFAMLELQERRRTMEGNDAAQNVVRRNIDEQLERCEQVRTAHEAMRASLTQQIVHHKELLIVLNESASNREERCRFRREGIRVIENTKNFLCEAFAKLRSLP